MLALAIIWKSGKMVKRMEDYRRAQRAYDNMTPDDDKQMAYCKLTDEYLEVISWDEFSGYTLKRGDGSCFTVSDFTFNELYELE